jgi:GIY-YIG catalytic domain
MTTVNPFKLPRIAYKNKLSLPASPGIYYVLNLTSNEIIYVGKSKNIRARWNGHHRDWDVGMLQAVYKAITVVIAWELCAKENLSNVERKRIKECNPILNGKNIEDSEAALFSEDIVESSPHYFRYLTANLSQATIDSIPEQDLKYLKRKADLLDLLNYHHPNTNQLIPRYKFFEQDCLMHFSVNVTKDPLFAESASDIYELVNDELRALMNYFSQPDADSWSFKSLSWSEKKVVHALTNLFGYFVEAGIKAIDSVTPIQDFHAIFLEQVQDISVEASFLTILRPIYRKAAKRNWWLIHASAVVDLDGRIHDTLEE